MMKWPLKLFKGKKSAKNDQSLEEVDDGLESICAPLPELISNPRASTPRNSAEVRRSLDKWNEARKARTSLEIAVTGSTRVTDRLSLQKARGTTIINGTYAVLGKTLGSGSFGRVQLCLDIHTLKLCAVKQCSKKQILYSMQRQLPSKRSRSSFDKRVSRSSDCGSTCTQNQTMSRLEGRASCDETRVGTASGFVRSPGQMVVPSHPSRQYAATGTCPTAGHRTASTEGSTRLARELEIAREKFARDVEDLDVLDSRNGRESSTFPRKRSSMSCSSGLLGGPDPMDLVRREIAIMKQLDHPNIVRLLEVIDDPSSDYLLMVMEYVDGGTLEQTRVGHQRWERVPENRIHLWVREVLQGLDYLHWNEVVHGDLKPANLLMSSTGRIKLADFGSAVVCSDASCSMTSFGTAAFRAPESLHSGYIQATSMDIWALGVCLYVWVFGCLPFEGPTPYAIYEQIKVPQNVLVSPGLRDLLRGLLQKDQHDRITLEQAMNHPWVTAGGIIPMVPVAQTLPSEKRVGQQLRRQDFEDAIQSTLPGDSLGLQLMDHIFREREFPEGSVLFRAQSNISQVFLIAEGAVDILSPDEDGGKDVWISGAVSDESGATSFAVEPLQPRSGRANSCDLRLPGWQAGDASSASFPIGHRPGCSGAAGGLLGRHGHVSSEAVAVLEPRSGTSSKRSSCELHSGQAPEAQLASPWSSFGDMDDLGQPGAALRGGSEAQNLGAGTALGLGSLMTSLRRRACGEAAGRGEAPAGGSSSENWGQQLGLEVHEEGKQPVWRCTAVARSRLVAMCASVEDVLRLYSQHPEVQDQLLRLHVQQENDRMVAEAIQRMHLGS